MKRPGLLEQQPIHRTGFAWIGSDSLVPILNPGEKDQGLETGVDGGRIRFQTILS